ncbi:hypothetical protein FISHEDRAFT_58279 [Fistulina hepatica ATCC 64428]|nr:hypothetical protein FISHEDRAFT_58279 [Fistulina hepatica ATCC 64428]
MSYAEVTALHLPPNQAVPDPALFNTGEAPAPPATDDNAQVKFVSPESHESSQNVTSSHDTPEDGSNNGKNSSKRDRRMEIKQESCRLWQIAETYLLRPGVAGGLIGLVNLGLLAGATRAFIVNPHYRRDARIIGTTAAAALGLTAAEGFAVNAYQKTERGQAEERRAKEEGTFLYKHAREIVLRPGVLGGLVGLVNLAVLGTLGWVSYQHWDKPTWDRRTVSAVFVSLFTLWGGEGYLAEKYTQRR